MVKHNQKRQTFSILRLKRDPTVTWVPGARDSYVAWGDFWQHSTPEAFSRLQAFSGRGAFPRHSDNPGAAAQSARPSLGLLTHVSSPGPGKETRICIKCLLFLISEALQGRGSWILCFFVSSWLKNKSLTHAWMHTRWSDRFLSERVTLSSSWASQKKGATPSRPHTSNLCLNIPRGHQSLSPSPLSPALLLCPLLPSGTRLLWVPPASRPHLRLKGNFCFLAPATVKARSLVFGISKWIQFLKIWP